VGTMMLMFAAAASAVVASRLSHDAVSATLLQAFGTSGSLVALINAFGAISGGHFNPIITAGQWIGGERSLRCMLAYVPGQTVGAIFGALLVRAVFPSPPSSMTPDRWLAVISEIIATTGLMTIVFGCSRAQRRETGPFSVGAWLVGMILYLPSSYANPALVLGALFASGPIALGGESAFAFVPAQVLGGILALIIVSIGYGRRDPQPRTNPVP
jgi:glycerol uptake facilitator-like aquaporin